ncbi:DUF6636 domain-containing protein [Nocardia rhizosphaerae]|uniref:DUF6636 domain-containing protein n=1 Tax=Nocardia rhizosphaerae TaxID=1691571 RepID=A0ABV8L171_9NOCA
MRAVIMMAAVVALTGGLAACGTDQGSSAPTSVAQPSGAPGTTQPSGASDTTRPPAPDAGTSDAEEPERQDPAVVPEAGSAPPAAAAPGDRSAPSAPTDDRFTTVDAGRFRLDGGYYFQSPTGNIMCGILAMAPYGVGCQLGHANYITPKLPNCTDAPNRKVAVHLYEGKPEFLCTSQGIFVGIPQDGSAAGGPVLNYGESLTVDGYTCSSSSQGVRCLADGHGFAISADDQHTF